MAGEEKKEVTLIELQLDDASVKKSLDKEKAARGRQEKEAARKPPDEKTISRLIAAAEKRRVKKTIEELAEQTAAFGPTALEAIAGGKLGVGAFAASKLQSLGKRVFFPGLEAEGDAGALARAKFGRFTAAATSVVGKAAAVEKVVTVGLPILSTLIETGIKEVAPGDPLSQKIAGVVSDGMKKITDLVQEVEARISALSRTAGEGVSLAKGIALTGADFGKMPDLLSKLYSVNVRESKLEKDMSEAALREGTNHVAEFIRKNAADVMSDALSKRTR